MRYARFTLSWALVLGALMFSSAAILAQDADPAEAKEAEQAKFKALKSPVPYTDRSVGRGKAIYLRYCTECHGLDGRAQIDVVANATNLTSPEKYFHGTTEGEIFRSIRDGAGIDMPPFKAMFKKEEDLWHLTNFVRSLWPEEVRPKVQTDAAVSGGEAGEDKASSEGADHDSKDQK